MAPLFITAAIMAIALASAGLYLWRRKWIDALLIIIAGAALAGLVAQLPMPSNAAPPVSINSDDVAPVVGDAALVKLRGDGLRAAQWHDLPARKLEWTAPSDPVLRLDFAHVATPGRAFRMTVTMSSAGDRRLQLLAENGQVIAEAAGDSAALTVQWIPPVAETLLVKERLRGRQRQGHRRGPGAGGSARDGAAEGTGPVRVAVVRCACAQRGAG